MRTAIVRSLLGGMAMGLVLAASQSKAQVVTPDPTAPSSGAQYGNVGTTLTTPINSSSFLQFNPSLGTLIEVELTLTENVTYTSLSVANTSGSAVNFPGFSTTATATVPGSYNVVVTASSDPAGGISVANHSHSAQYTGTGTASQIVYITSANQSVLNGFTAPNSNPSYMTLPVEFQLANPIPGESPPNFGSGLSGASTAGATFHIEYEYSPVPEGSIIGLVAGLGCLAALVRRGRD